MTDFTGKVNCTCGKEMNGGGGQVGGTLSCTYRNCECGIGAIFYTIPKSSSLTFKVEHEDQPLIDLKEREKLLSCFNLANIEVLEHWDILNKYSGSKANWILAKTNLGLIQIGWRKRVINIEWPDTGIEMIVDDSTTKDKTMVHAWSYAKAVDYLEQLVNASEMVSNEA